MPEYEIIKSSHLHPCTRGVKTRMGQVGFRASSSTDWARRYVNCPSTLPHLESAQETYPNKDRPQNHRPACFSLQIFNSIESIQTAIISRSGNRGASGR
uniref:Uncharacterized protein n=1 Tax=Utricularia reniformis TaxID=192314 RepID=A0A1Y0B444_9LAMI|nr:hypothetical protein AEK19_MT2070 [Utricularia reniformis]ART32226.1 hypothetical protein AEK19_MT2070 [Utricularia reniformis]